MSDSFLEAAMRRAAELDVVLKYEHQRARKIKLAAVGRESLGIEEEPVYGSMLWDSFARSLLERHAFNELESLYLRDPLTVDTVELPLDLALNIVHQVENLEDLLRLQMSSRGMASLVAMHANGGELALASTYERERGSQHETVRSLLAGGLTKQQLRIFYPSCHGDGNHTKGICMGCSAPSGLWLRCGHVCCASCIFDRHGCVDRVCKEDVVLCGSPADMLCDALESNSAYYDRLIEKLIREMRLHAALLLKTAEAVVPNDGSIASTTRLGLAWLLGYLVGTITAVAGPDGAYDWSALALETAHLTEDIRKAWNHSSECIDMNGYSVYIPERLSLWWSDCEGGPPFAIDGYGNQGIVDAACQTMCENGPHIMRFALQQAWDYR